MIIIIIIRCGKIGRVVPTGQVLMRSIVDRVRGSGEAIIVLVIGWWSRTEAWIS